MTLRSAISVLLAALVLGTSVLIEALEDWPQWRGPRRDGVSAERGLLKSWPQSGPPLAWKVGGAGEGYSSFAVAEGRLFTLGARADREYVVAYDATTGKRLWEVPHGRRFTSNRGDGPRSTPTVDGNRVYAFGANGDLTALDVASGHIAWTVNVIRDFGGQNITWGLSESPLVSGDRIIVSPGGSGSAIVAVNKADGKLLWKSEADRAGYSSAVLHEMGGVRQAIYFTGQRALGIDLANGRVLWSYDRVANRTANIATPIAHGNHVFLSSDYGTGAALLQLTPAGGGITAREVYFTREMRNHHASSVLTGDYLYGFSGAILTAMRFETGEVAWRDRSVGKGSLVCADGRLYLFSEGGVVGLAEATPEGYREHGRFSLAIGSLPTWSHPVVSNGKLFLRDQDTVYAYDVRSREADK
jgi:outer membrane protein assembly factor BamB